MTRNTVPARLLFALVMLVSAPIAFANDAVEVLRRSHEAMVKRGYFVCEMTADAGGRNVDSRVEVVWPDRYHITSSGDGVNTELIVVPGSTWMKQGGQWMKLPMDMGQMIKAFQPDSLKEALDGITNAEELPRDSVDGKSARVFRYDTQGTVMGVKSKSTIKTWLDEETLLPLMQEVDGEAMGMRSRTTQRYSYPDELKIEAPN